MTLLEVLAQWESKDLQLGLTKYSILKPKSSRLQSFHHPASQFSHHYETHEH